MEATRHRNRDKENAAKRAKRVGPRLERQAAAAARKQRSRELATIRHFLHANTWFDSTCADCGGPVLAKANPGRYCEGCKAERRRAKGRRVASSTVMLVALRDQGICQLCLEPCDLEFDRNNPRSITIDHVKPIAQGRDDSVDNLQTAHLGCNVAKG